MTITELPVGFSDKVNHIVSEEIPYCEENEKMFHHFTKEKFQTVFNMESTNN